MFFSDRIRRSVQATNGIYCIRTDVDDIWSTLSIASLDDALDYFSKSSNFNLIRGISFHQSFIPDNPLTEKKLPVNVIDGQFDEFDKICTIKGPFGYYFAQVLDTPESYILMDLKELLKSGGDINKLKNTTPAMRIVYAFHILERKQKEESEPLAVIKKNMELSGAKIVLINKTRQGFEVIWRMLSHTISTVMDKTFHVIEAGFCTSGGDQSQSAHSIPHLLKSYVEDGSYIHKTRSVN